MATVYLAHDLKHDRPVALKVLHPELAVALGPERFRREIHLAARLQHPHILTVLDSGETAPERGGVDLWFTMPYVDGESLRERLTRDRQLPVETAVRIARDAAQALQYAHEHGVIHRDIKPENLLLTRDESVLVADFGIARALTGGDRVTETGLAIGTPAYMSPEQAAGEQNLDARTDIYSLGAVLYEMLVGEAPFTGPSAQAVIARRMTEAPRPVRATRETVPPALDDAVTKALARAPADRFATAEEFGRVLTGMRMTTSGQMAAATSPGSGRRSLLGRPLVTVFALGLLLGLGLLFAWSRWGRSVAEDSGVKRLAVLPFENLGDSSDAYFADGMTDEIRGKLAMLPGLQVIASSSVGQYRRTAKSVQEVGRELDVGYLLVGKVRWEKSGGVGRVRVSPELIEVGRGAPTIRWQQPFDAPLTDLFQMQGEIAERVVQSLNVAIAPAQEQQLAARPTENVAAYDAYLQANALLGTGGGTPAGNVRPAIGLLERAVALDSGFAGAWAQLSRAHSVAYFLLVANPRDSAAAESAARRALRLNPKGAAGYVALGDYFKNVVNDPIKSLEQYDAGRRLVPQDANLLTQAALAQMTLGRWDDALAGLQEGAKLDPRSLATVRRLSYTLARMRRFSEATEAADRAVAIEPQSFEAIHNRILVDLEQGDLAGARAILSRAAEQVDPTALFAYVATYFDLYWLPDPTQRQLLLRLPPSAFGGVRSDWALALSQAFDLEGDRARSRAYADTAQSEYSKQLLDAPNDPSSHGLLGLALAYAGKMDDAIREGRRAVELQPLEKDHFSGPYFEHLLLRVYLRAGQTDKALDILERLTRVPYLLTPGWLRIDPAFDPIRKNPRFQKLLAGA